jgi:hypothetical protein
MRVVFFYEFLQLKALRINKYIYIYLYVFIIIYVYIIIKTNDTSLVGGARHITKKTTKMKSLVIILADNRRRWLFR